MSALRAIPDTHIRASTANFLWGVTLIRHYHGCWVALVPGDPKHSRYLRKLYMLTNDPGKGVPL